MTNAKQILLGITLAVVIFVVLISVRSIALGEYQVNTNTNTQTNSIKNTNNANSGDVQHVKLSMKNYEYVLEPSELIKGVPVEMEVDLETVYGCMRSIVIPSFGVREYVNEKDNTFEFTPDKTGEFSISCSMNMGRGKFSVVEKDGTKSNYVDAAAADDYVPEPGSCGAAPGGEGGCGCDGY